MEYPVRQRLKQYLKKHRISNTEFGKTLGVSNAYVTSVRDSIPPDKLKIISTHYPDLNILWLLTGEGEMLNNPQGVGNGASGVVISGRNNYAKNIDNRQYYSDSPAVLRAQIDLLEERIKEKDAQIKEKDAQIKEKDAQIKQLLDIIQGKIRPNLTD